MLRLILARLAESCGVVLLLTLLVFVLMAAAGGDPSTQWQLEGRLSDQAASALRRLYGLDDPVWQRYWRWLGEIARGEFGVSISFQTPVAALIWPRLLRTSAVALPAFGLAWAVALVFGLVGAQRPRSPWDRLGDAIVVFGSSAPRLVLALLVLALAAQTGFGIGGIGIIGGIGAVFVLSIPLSALFLAQTRAAAGSVIDADYVRTARAKGLDEGAILRRHVLRPALTPLFVTAGTALGATLSGSVVVERILGWPGIGDLTVTAVRNRDLPLLLGIVLVTSVIVLAGNLLADIFMRLNDPRLDNDAKP